MDFDFTTETITPDTTNVLTIGGTGGIEISVGTTAQRPVSPVNGTLRYNTDDSRFEVYQGSDWINYTDALYVPGSTFKTIQDFINLVGSRGIFSGGLFTDNNDGTIAVSAGTGQLHDVNSTLSDLYFIDFPAVSSLSLTDNALNYIFVDYNSGSPQVISTVTPNFDSRFAILGQVFRSGTTLTLNNWTRLKLDNSIAGVINRFESVQSFEHESGAVLSASGTRNFAITAGSFWEGIDRIVSSAIDTAVASTFTYWYRTAPTTWTSVPGQTQIDNNSWNDPTSGLVNLNNNNFGTHWVYIGTDNSCHVVYGITNTNLATAQDTQPPPNPPNALLTKILVGRIIIQRNASTFAEVASAFDIVFTGGATSIHNELGGLQGGTIAEYFHTTARENSLIVSLDTLGTGILAKTSPTTLVNRTLTAGTGISITNGDGVAGNPTISATGGSGTVTSVDVSGGTTGLTTTGGPVTTSGTITLTGTLGTANGGTNLTTIGSALQVLRVNAGGTGLEYATIGGSGTVTSVAATQPAAGLTITGSPITTSGTLTFALANDLSAVEALATTGLATRTGTDTWTTRTVTGTTNQISVTNGSGVAGNPTVALADDLILPGTAGMVLPDGTTAERPVSPSNGTVRYNTTLGKTEIYQNGVWYQVGTVAPGGVGIVAVYTNTIPATSGTSTVPYDNTIPLVAEGTEIWNTAITPSQTASSLKFTIPFTVDCGTSNRVVIASLFRGSTNIGSAVWYATGGGRPTTITLSISDSPATTSPVTYSMRAGIGAGAATWYINSTASGNNLGGALISSYQIVEVV